MRVLLLLALASLASIAFAANVVAPTYAAKTVPPVTGACPHRNFECFPTVELRVERGGVVSGAKIVESSGDRGCDQATLAAVRKWRYDKSAGPLKHTLPVLSYVCPLPGPAPNNSFKPTPLRGAA